MKTAIIAVLSFAAGFAVGVFSLWFYFARKGVLGCLVLALMLAASVSAQAPTNTLETAIKELQSEIQRTRAEVKALRVQQERQAAEERQARQRQSIRTQRRVTREPRPAKSVAKKNADIEIRIVENEAELKQAEMVLAEIGTAPKDLDRAEQQKVIAALVIQRNALREKIRRQNNKRACRWFRVGCIKQR